MRYNSILFTTPDEVPARDELPDALSTALSLMLRRYPEEETEFPVSDPNRERREAEDFFVPRLRKVADRLIASGYVK